MITQNFGSPTIAERNLDIYTAAVLREAFVKHVEPSASWRKQMDRVSEVSCADYRKLVRDDKRFVDYFRQATPELELGSLNIGTLIDFISILYRILMIPFSLSLYEAWYN